MTELDDVPPSQVRVGDAIVAWADTNTGNMNTIARPWTVTTVPAYRSVACYVDAVDRDPKIWAGSVWMTSLSNTQPSPIWYPTQSNAPAVRFRIQRSASALETVFRGEPTPTRVIDEYPGKCTRCGRRAYVGAFEIAHANEVAAASCPARRA